MKKIAALLVFGFAVAGQVQAESFVNSGDLAAATLPGGSDKVREVVVIAGLDDMGPDSRPYIQDILPAGSNKARAVVAFADQAAQGFVGR